MMGYCGENSIPCDIIYGQTGAGTINRIFVFVNMLTHLIRTNMVAAYVCACQTMGMAANRQRIYHGKGTATHSFKPGDWVLYWNNPKSLHSLSNGWTGPFVMVENVSPVDYIIQFAPDGKKKTVHCDEQQMDTCNQDRTNWVKDKLTHRLNQNTVTTDRVLFWLEVTS